MFARLLLLFTVVPALELFLLIKLGQWIGALPTVGIILVTGGLGAWLAKREGLDVLRQLQQETQQGMPPAERLVEGLLVLVGGVLLITPGVVTDLTGFLLIMPWSRRWLAPRVGRWVVKRFLGAEGGLGATFTMGGSMGGGMGGSMGGTAPAEPRTREPLRRDEPGPAAGEIFHHPRPKEP